MTRDPISTRVSARARSIEPTAIREFRSRATDDSLDLGIGQTDLRVPEPIRAEIARLAEEGLAPYSDNLGRPDTRRAVADHCGVEPDRVMITCGVQEGLAVALFGLVDPDDSVLVPDPAFPAYANLVRAAGATPVRYPLDADDDFALDVDAVRDRLRDDTSALLVNSPSNPTGTVHDPDALEALADLLAERDVAWIADDIYEAYTWDDADHVPLDTLAPDDAPGIRLGALSKSMHMMGWRVGWAIAPPDWIRDLKPLHQHLVTCAPTLQQAAAVPALERFDDLFESTHRTFRHRRDVALERARELPGVDPVVPEGAFYLFLDARAYTNATNQDDQRSTMELAEAILDEQDVVLVPGTGFGPAGEGFLRAAYTTEPDTLHRAFDRLDTFFQHRI